MEKQNVLAEDNYFANNNEESLYNELNEAEDEGTTSSEFDYDKLPDAPVQKYDRVELNGKIVTIKKASIDRNERGEWKPTLKNKELEYKGWNLKVFFDTTNNDREVYSGLRIMRDKGKTVDETKVAPSLYAKGKNQVAKLFAVYKTYILKSGVSEQEFNEKYGLKKLMHFLNSSPKAKIVTEDILFQDKVYRKNMIAEFI